MKSFREIESIYIKNTSSPVYSILANYYYQKKQFHFVIKVCEEGLRVHTNDLGGLYIYSKALIMLGKFEKAERQLKKIIKVNQYNPQSCLLLISIMEHLGRSPNSISTYVRIMNSLFINHPHVQSLNKKYPYNNKKISRKKIESRDSVKPVASDKFIQNNQLATKTMYSLLVAQKKYQEALDVLNILKLNHGADEKFIKNEFKKIKSKLM